MIQCLRALDVHSLSPGGNGVSFIAVEIEIVWRLFSGRLGWYPPHPHPYARVIVCQIDGSLLYPRLCRASREISP